MAGRTALAQLSRGAKLVALDLTRLAANEAMLMNLFSIGAQLLFIEDNRLVDPGSRLLAVVSQTAQLEALRAGSTQKCWTDPAAKRRPS